MGKCAKRAFESGGAISKADQLMAEMAAKYGVSGQAQAAPVQQPAPTPQPKPQPLPQQQGVASGIFGIMQGRQQQIDKASGYRNGGKIQGPGTPTSDSIPAKVKETGEGIAVSTNERILSADQDAMLEAMARKSGFDNLDAMLEAGTGKPVGPTIKGGRRAAADGLSPEEEQKRIQAFGATPPTLGTGLNGMTRANPDTNFVTGSAPGIAPPSQTGRNASGVITAESAKAAYAPESDRTNLGTMNLADQNERMAKSLGYSGTDDFNKQWRLRSDPVQQQAELAANGRPDAVAMRGQDINAKTDAIRAGLDVKRLGLAQAADDRAADRWSVERPGILAQAKDSDAVRGARQGLMDAVASGDQKAIEQARAKAVAAGIKFDKPNNEYVTTTDSMGMNITRTNKDTGAVDVIEGKSGKVKASIPGPGAQQAAHAPVPQGFTVVGTANGKRVLQDAQGKRFVEGN